MPLLPEFDYSADHYRRILGILFYVGPIEGLVERTMRGGLVVVPSAPVLVNLPTDPVHRAAIESSDLAVMDSGFLVLLWRVFARERIRRISGLRYLRALLDEPRFRDSRRILWVMPSKEDESGNCAWLRAQGVVVGEEDCYLAPIYARQGALEDPALLAQILARRPQFVMINLGGGVQERLGSYLRGALAAAQTPPVIGAKLFVTGEENSDPNNQHPVTNNRAAPAYWPTLICTGAAIAFLSNRQANIPPWADRLFLGWLIRSLHEPTKFIPRYWHSLRLAALLWKHGSKSVSG